MKKYFCVFTYEGEVVGSIELMDEESINNYNSVWGINPFETIEEAKEFALQY